MAKSLPDWHSTIEGRSTTGKLVSVNCESMDKRAADMQRVIILVADGFGIGAAPDAAQFSDEGANTLGHIATHYRKETGKQLDLPNLSRMGLMQASGYCTGTPVDAVNYSPDGGAFGAACEISTGKDTPSGHWEMTGAPVLFEWGYYDVKPDCFPIEFLDALAAATGVPGFLGNCHASGTDIIRDLGEEHIKTGKPICYTSADSVFQVAAHETAFGLDRLYEFCEAARELLYKDNIGRVIARPFIGNNAGDFSRTGNRRDYSIEPPADTLLDRLVADGGKVFSVGKISDIFAHRGITSSTKATGLAALIDTTLAKISEREDRSIIFTNLVNFDQDFGHRRDPMGYANALSYFDGRLNEIKAALTDDDLLIITSDHGCDPTWRGTDHTREYVPVLAWRKNLVTTDLGLRTSFADIGQTLAGYLGLGALDYGKSFLPALAV